MNELFTDKMAMALVAIGLLAYVATLLVAYYIGYQSGCDTSVNRNNGHDGYNDYNDNYEGTTTPEQGGSEGAWTSL